MSAVLLGAVAALAWGTHDFAARFAARAVGHRLATLGVTLAGIGWLAGWLWYTGLSVSANVEHLWLLAVTGVGFTFATLWLFAALAIGPLAIVGPIAGAYPVFAVFIALVRGAQPALGEWGGMGVVLLGVGMVARYGSTPDTAGGAKSPSGSKARVIGLAVLSSLAFALSITAGQSAAPHYGELQATLLARCFGFVAIAAMVLWRGDWRPVAGHQLAASAAAQWWPLLVVMGALDAVALGAVLSAGNQSAPELATVVSSAFGAVTVLCGWVFLRERISGPQWLGIALVFAGVAVLSWTGS